MPPLKGVIHAAVFDDAVLANLAGTDAARVAPRSWGVAAESIPRDLNLDFRLFSSVLSLWSAVGQATAANSLDPCCVTQEGGVTRYRLLGSLG
jgi:hypothetical protein